MTNEVENLEGLRAVKISITEKGVVIGRAFLYLINNTSHDCPYGLIEDLWVDESYRKQGIGSKIIIKVLEEAKRQNCYKVIAQSRYEKQGVHYFYEKNGFKDHGKNFRIDL